MIWVKNNIIPFKGFTAITIWPFVFYRGNLHPITKNHEKIHWWQQFDITLVALVLIFGLSSWLGFKWWYLSFLLMYYVIYVGEWLIRLIFNDAEEAYYLISFEREAYCNQINQNYLKNNRCFAWLKYYKKYG